MKLHDMHTQCTLKKGSTFQISWIPKKFAKIGKFLRLKEDNGWEVIKTGGTLPSKMMNLVGDTYRQHRKVTDI